MGRFGHRGKLLNFAEKIYLKEIYFSAKLCGHQIMHHTLVKSSVNSHVGGFPLADPAEVVRNWCGKSERNFENPTAEGFLFFFISKNLILTGIKHCGESRRCHNVSTGPVLVSNIMSKYCRIIRSEHTKT